MMRARAIAVLLVAVACLPSCAEAPPRQEVSLPIALPEAWTGGKLDGPGSDAQWWKQLQDATLDALIGEALEASPTLTVALQRVEAANALAVAAGADALPQLSAGASAQRQQVLFFAPGAGSRTNRFTTHSLSMNLSWELDLWGRIRAGQAAAMADTQALEAAYHGVRISLIAQVIKGYYAATDGRLQLDLAEANLNSVASLAERVEERYNAGLRSALDLRLTLAEVAAARASAVSRRRALDVGLRRLEVLLGRYPAARIDTGRVIPDALGVLPAGLPSSLLERRPDLVQAERQLAANERRYQEAKCALLPRISLTGSGGTVAEDLGDLLDGDMGVWNILGNLTAPIIDGGRLRANVDRTLAEHEGAIASFFEVALRAFSEVEIALHAEQDLRDEQLALRDAVTESEVGLEISEERYFTGVMDILDVLEARRRFFTARSELLRVQRSRIENRVDLHLALGGGFEESGNRESMGDTGSR